MNTSKKEKKAEKMEPQYTGFKKFLKEWIEPIVVAFVLVFIFKVFFFQNFKIPSGSMEDTLLIGDYLFASKFTYGTKIPFTHKRILKFKDPKPGENDIRDALEGNLCRCGAHNRIIKAVRDAAGTMEGARHEKR